MIIRLLNYRAMFLPLLIWGFCSVLFLDAANGAELKVLGLKELINIGLDYSPQVKEAEYSIRSAEEDLAQAKAGRWAQLDATAVLGPVEDAKEPIVVVKPATRPSGVQIGRLFEDRNGIGFFGRLDLVISQPLFTFGKISHRMDAAARGVEVKRADREKRLGEVILNIKELYFALIVASQGQKAAKDADSFIGDASGRIQRLIKAGSTKVDESDLYRLDAYDAEVKQFKIKAESGARLAYLALKNAIGYPADKDFKLDATELPKDTRTLDVLDEYTRKAMAKRPELEQLKKGIEAQKSLVEAARADLFPSIFLAGIGSFAGAPGREHLDSTFIRDEFNHADFGVVLGSQWHFDLGIGSAKVRKEAAEYGKLLQTKEYAERNIPLEVAKYYQDAVEARESFQTFEKGAAAARRWIVSSFSGFDMGIGTAKDMFDAIERYGKNQGEYLLALYNYHVALARLSHAVADYRTANP